MKFLFYQAITAFISSTSRIKKFTFLTKSEPSGKSSTDIPCLSNPKKKFNWVIDEGKCLNSAQVKKLRQYCEQNKIIGLQNNKPILIRDWFMVELGLYTGLRVAEMADIKVGDLNIENNNSSLIVKNGKGGKSRIVCFNNEFKQVCLFFLQWKKENNSNRNNISNGTCLPVEKESFIFTDKSGNQLTKRALQKAFKRCLGGVGLGTDYGIHCLRHTFATHLYKSSGHNLRLVQKQLGHSSIRTTQVYADLLDEDVKQAVRKLYR